jgi:hypothetical protein
MKKLLLSIVALLVCLSTFGQGKVLFATDSLHLVYYNPFGLPSALAGQAVSSNNMPAGITLVADLYMGTSSSQLSLISTTTFGVAPGKWNNMSITAPSPLATGTTVFMLAQIRDASHAAEAVWTPAFDATAAMGFALYGRSSVFTFTLGGPITYPPMYLSPNWAVGTYNMDQYAGAGARGAIMVGIIPEPSSLTLAGLVIAGAWIFRRRK